MVDGFYVPFQKRIGAHVRPEIAVIHAIKRIDLQGECLKMPRKKCGADTILLGIRRLLPLHIIQEDGNMRDILVGEFLKQELVHEDFTEPILAARSSRSQLS